VRYVRNRDARIAHRVPVRQRILSSLWFADLAVGQVGASLGFDRHIAIAEAMS